jgi:hypothetical protein
MTRLTELTQRGVIAVEGEDRIGFLQGLVSNDAAAAVPGQAVWAALLTPQGKWLADFFILADGPRLLLDCERGQSAMLVQRLTRFRLRSKVTIRAEDDWRVYAGWDGTPLVDAPLVDAPLVDGPLVEAPPIDAPRVGRLVARDPRLPEAGWRVLSPQPLPANATEADYDRHRIGLGLPDGSRDLESEKSVLLEAGFDELAGVSWTKGCYMGQELTARTKYRGLLKRRIFPVEIEGPPPASGTAILRDGAEVGTMRSTQGTAGLAVLRLDAVSAPHLMCGEARIVPRVPAWMHLPEAVA